MSSRRKPPRSASCRGCSRSFRRSKSPPQSSFPSPAPVPHHTPESVPMRSPWKLTGLIATLIVPAIVSAQTYPSAADPRSNLKPGRLDAGTAESNMRLVSFSPKPAQFDSARGLTFINSDVAFGNGHYAYQGNFAGFTVWDVSNPAKPVVTAVVDCITSQGDPTIIGHLLFVSAEGAGNRNDCGKGGVRSEEHTSELQSRFGISYAVF